MTRLTSNIQKGGAMLDDSRRLVEAWDTNEPAEVNLERLSAHNLLAKRSRVRADDVLRRVLGPRLVEPGPQVISALKVLAGNGRAFAEACYYEAGRDDALLAEFAAGPLMAWHEAGRVTITVQEVVEWLRLLEKEDTIPHWSETIKIKVARGLLAALRDFGVLTGAMHKEFVPPGMTLPGFAYVAFRLHEQGASSRVLVTSPVWRRWLLTEPRVAELFRAADRLRLLRYSEAGTAVRVDWLAGSLPEVVRAAA